MLFTRGPRSPLISSVTWGPLVDQGKVKWIVGTGEKEESQS